MTVCFSPYDKRALSSSSALVPRDEWASFGSCRCCSPISPLAAEVTGQATLLPFSARKDRIKLLRLLNVFDSLNRLRLDFNRLFGGKACVEIQSCSCRSSCSREGLTMFSKSPSDLVKQRLKSFFAGVQTPHSSVWAYRQQRAATCGLPRTPRKISGLTRGAASAHEDGAVVADTGRAAHRRAVCNLSRALSGSTSSATPRDASPLRRPPTPWAPSRPLKERKRRLRLKTELTCGSGV
ncbi:hypothetical protein BS78_08G154900 [Paspalum vaginatum]|nr:hypothetical protein BS78_08G154900 [Paspalum vaginatum]